MQTMKYARKTSLILAIGLMFALAGAANAQMTLLQSKISKDGLITLELSSANPSDAAGVNNTYTWIVTNNSLTTTLNGVAAGSHWGDWCAGGKGVNGAVLLRPGKTIESVDLSLGPAGTAEAGANRSTSDGSLTIDVSQGIVLEDLERTIIERVLALAGWNRTKAAQLLGLSRETLRYRIEKHYLKALTSPGDA